MQGEKGYRELMQSDVTVYTTGGTFYRVAGRYELPLGEGHYVLTEGVKEDFTQGSVSSNLATKIRNAVNAKTTFSNYVYNNKFGEVGSACSKLP